MDAVEAPAAAAAAGGEEAAEMRPEEAADGAELDPDEAARAEEGVADPGGGGALAGELVAAEEELPLLDEPVVEHGGGQVPAEEDGRPGEAEARHRRGPVGEGAKEGRPLRGRVLLFTAELDFRGPGRYK